MAQPIEERLRAFHAEIVASDGGESEQMTMTREAFEEIDRLKLAESENAKLKEALRRQYSILRELARAVVDLDPGVKELAEIAFKRMPGGEADPRAPEAVLMAKAFSDGHTAGHRDSLARVRVFSEAVAEAIEAATSGPLTRERLAMLAEAIRERAKQAPPTN